jgi:hypothetical protein
VALAFALVEGFARACLPRPEFVAGCAFDPELGFTGVPGKELVCCDEAGTFPWVLNAHGARGPDLPPAKGPDSSGASRVLFLGDSFLQGWQVRVESLVPARVEALLAEGGLATETTVLASTGWGTGQELLALRRHGARVRPDVVVLCFYSGNDVVDNSLDLAGRTTVSAGAWVRPYFVVDEAQALELAWLHPWRSWMRRHSYLFALLDLHDYRRRHHDVGQFLRVEEDRPVAPLERLAKGLLVGADLELFRAPSPGSDWERAWRTSEALFLALEQERALGARATSCASPSRNEDLFGHGWSRWGCDPFGLGPSWVMKKGGWIALRRGERYVLEAEVPAGARYPLEFLVQDVDGAHPRPRIVSGPGPFELALDTRAAGPGPQWMPVLVQASQTVPNPDGEPVGMVLRSLRRLP